MVAVAACAAAPSPPITAKHEAVAAPNAIPSLFAPLFRDGATWSFAAETTVGGDGTPHPKQAGRVTCTVPTTRTLAHAWLAELRCTGIVAEQPVDGVLVATTAGMWHVDGPLAEQTDVTVAALTPTTMAIDASPRAREHTNHLPNEEQETYAVQHGAGDSWCFNYGTNIGDDRGWMLCIDATVGLVGGSAFWTGNTTTITSFGKTP